MFHCVDEGIVAPELHRIEKSFELLSSPPLSSPNLCFYYKRQALVKYGSYNNLAIVLCVTIFLVPLTEDVRVMLEFELEG